MPNHIHGIIEIKNANIVPPVGIENFQPLPAVTENRFQKVIPRSVGSIVRGFKIGVTKWFRSAGANDYLPQQKIWQRNYYDHIIRNSAEYNRISNYIITNPFNWKEDRFY